MDHKLRLDARGMNRLACRLSSWDYHITRNLRFYKVVVEFEVSVCDGNVG